MTRAELSDILSLAERLLSGDEIGVLATLFCSHGSTYRPLGSMMVSGPGSMIAGGVSGGCVEEYVARHGRMLVQQQPAAMLSFDADPNGDAADAKPSLGCGGSIEVLVERLTPDHLAFLHRFRAAHEADVASTTACVIDTAIAGSIQVRRTGFDPDASQADLQRFAKQCSDQTKPRDGNPAVPRPSDRHTKSQTALELELLRSRAAAEERSGHRTLDESRRALIHFIPPMTRLVILGAGDDARPMCTLARSLGWHTTVADRRGRLATCARFADADEVIAANWESTIQRIAFTPRTAVVMMTHSLADDVAILPLLANKPMAYIGALGPDHRRTWVLAGAAETTDLDPAFIARFRGPIGLNLGDRSPGGIAVAIVAEILAELNQRDAAPLSTQSSLPRPPVHTASAHA